MPKFCYGWLATLPADYVEERHVVFCWACAPSSPSTATTAAHSRNRMMCLKT